MMEDEVAALVVDNGSGKSESTLECNKRAVVHFQNQAEIRSKFRLRNFDFRPKFRFFGQISGSTILTHFSIFLKNNV